MRRKKGAGGISLPDFRLYYKATAIKTVMVLAQEQKYIPMEQDREPRDKPTHLPYLIFDKGSKDILWSKDSLFNKWCWKNWTAMCKRVKLEHFLMPYMKIKSKWIRDLNGRPVTMKLRVKYRQNTR